MVPATITQAEQKPDSREKGHRQQAPVFPKNQFVRQVRRCRQSGKNTFRRQPDHSSHKRQVGDGTSLIPGKHQSQSSAKRGSGKGKDGNVTHSIQRILNNEWDCSKEIISSKKKEAGIKIPASTENKNNNRLSHHFLSEQEQTSHTSTEQHRRGAAVRNIG